MLYLGPVVFRSILPSNLYHNFMVLSVAIFFRRVGINKILLVVEYLCYDMQQLMKQNEILAAQMERLVENRHPDDDLLFELDYSLPVSDHAGLEDIESLLSDNDKFKSLVSVDYYA